MKNHPKLIASDAGSKIGVAHIVGERLPDNAEHVVACVMTKIVVDFFESVEIQINNRKSVVTFAGAVQVILQGSIEHHSVRETTE